MYGKIVNGKLYLAPKKIVENGMITFNPTPEKLIELGYKQVNFFNPPTGIEGKMLIATWQQDSTTINQQWNLAEYPIDFRNDLDQLYLTSLQVLKDITKELDYNLSGKQHELDNIYNLRTSDHLFDYILTELQKNDPDKKLYQVMPNDWNHDYNILFESLKIKDYYCTIDPDAEVTCTAIKKNGERIDGSLFSRVRHLNNIIELEKSINGNSAIYNMILINIVSAFEIFLLKSISIFSKIEPKTLIGKDSSLELKELIDFSSMDEAIDTLISKKTNLLGWQDINSKIEYLEAKGFNLNAISPDWKDDIILLYETRNLLVHNNGTFNEGVQAKLNKTKYKYSYQLDDDLSPKHNEILRYITLIIESIEYIYLETKTKFLK